MRKTGRLSVNAGVSELDGMDLAKAGGQDAFADATNFLANRGLNSGDPIWVDGADGFVGHVPAFFITDAGASQ